GVASGTGAVPGVPGSGVLSTPSSSVLSTRVETVVNMPQAGVPAGSSGSLALVQDTLGGLNTVSQQRPEAISSVASGAD
ncbi:hypothetical protein, partial [Bartonella sp. AC66GZZY]